MFVEFVVVGNGRRIKLWEDTCGMESLATKFLDIYSITVKKEASLLIVGLVINKLGTWELEDPSLIERWGIWSMTGLWAMVMIE